MKSLRAIVKLAGPGSVTCMLLLQAVAVLAGGQAGSYPETKLTADDGGPLGSSVAIFGDTAVIGAEEDDDLGFGSGSAYVFERDPLDPTLWTETTKLTASDGGHADSFGNSVAIFGNTAVIGALVDGDLGLSSGSAYVFERDPLDPTLWTETAKLTASDGGPLTFFGNSVAISGDTAVIGSYSGSAYVFERDPLDLTRWTETAKLTASDGDRPGYSVAIAGETAVIGSLSGSAHVFERDRLDHTLWTQTAKLTPSDGPSDGFGYSVAVFEDTAVIGAPNDDDLGRYSGSTYVFQRDPIDPTLWTETTKLTASDGRPLDEFGYSVAISGGTAVIGAVSDSDVVRTLGSAYVFERDPLDATFWTQIAKLTASDGMSNDQFGYSVAIFEDTAVIGARFAGAAYVYPLEGCELDLALEPLTLRAGEELRAAMELHHRRPVTVTVPFLLWVEDAAGRVVAQRTSPPVTMEPGEHRQLRMAVTLPQEMQPGTYRVLVGVRRMQQGIARASQQFEIVE